MTIEITEDIDGRFVVHLIMTDACPIYMGSGNSVYEAVKGMTDYPECPSSLIHNLNNKG